MGTVAEKPQEKGKPQKPERLQFSDEEMARARGVDPVKLAKDAGVTLKGICSGDKGLLRGLCPFHSEKTPSFQVREKPENGRPAFHCFGCGFSGGPINFVMQWKGFTLPKAVRFLLNLPEPERKPARSQDQRDRSPKRHGAAETFPDLTGLEKGNASELEALAALRRIPLEGIRFAHDAGLLRFVTEYGSRHWVILDPSGRNTGKRRLDGKPFPVIGKPKSLAIKDSKREYPINATEPASAWLLAEGEPDLLAACWIATQIPGLRPAAMLGAATAISSEVLPFFSQARVILVAHADQAGLQAAEDWQKQLLEAGASVAILHAGEEKADLNDLVAEDPSGTLKAIRAFL